MFSSFFATTKTDSPDRDLKGLNEKFSGFDSFNIFTHKNPDGDALGSLLALGRILELQNKNADLFIFDSFDQHFNFFPYANRIRTQKESPKAGPERSLYVYLDCSSPHRTGFRIEPHPDIESVVIDHHLVGDPVEFDAIKIIDPGASSTAEILFDVAEKLNWEIDHDISFCLLAGILSDTGTLQHSNTSSKALRIVSRLIKNGVSLKKISDNLFKKKEVEGPLKIWGKILGRILIDEKIKMAYSFVSQEDLRQYNTSEDELSGLVNLLSGIPESDFSLLLVENKFGKVKASLRSESYKGIDVARIAKAFGGGGHKLAAGFEISGKIEENLDHIKETIENELSKQRISEMAG